jgi:multicomponent Na+:H+ antiporter subunit E
MGQKIMLFLTAFIAWCLLNWVPDKAHLVAGVFVAMLVTFMMAELFVQPTHALRHPQRYFVFVFQYIPVFLWELLKSNLDVAYRVMHPRLPIKPGIVKVKTSLRSEVAVTLLANSITLTPGTMTVDIDKENSVLYIHWIDVRGGDIEEATRIIVARFEIILKKIFE